ncbi:competence type IV pilus assembly protein ComGB [Desertibacillus haloalkaliphilus]|uniref:competence type IV pilus assembly protein ComGB n=1 Tax=Desertibacillus haloalkaliphilus TaxID=1328930 RepID=UPI001C27DC3D|nr:competence type IV pilus assembly protein ComGB [Desertibacillus haloalkaliphilus]MBU8905749.1 type II secretion system F family protein [Desertibacillus haloalkaliphilus]
MINGLVMLMRRDKWPHKQKAEFLKRLGLYMKQGYSVSAGIEMLSYYETREVKEKLDNLLKNLREGSTIHEALIELRFPKDILGYLYFSEKYGDLAEGLSEAGLILQKREAIKAKLQKVFRYPLLLLWMLIVISIVMLNYLFPHFQSLFASMDMEYPLITVLFLQMIDLLPLFLLLLFIFILISLIVYFTHFRRYTPQKKLGLLLKVPILNDFLSLSLTYYFTFQLSGLLKGGMSIFDALTVFEEQDHLPFFQIEASELKRDLQSGEEFSDALSTRHYFRKELPLVIKHGQLQGNLVLDLASYSELLLSTMESKVKKYFMFIQPVLFLLIGSVVLFMFLSIMIPMFQLMGSLG